MTVLLLSQHSTLLWSLEGLLYRWRAGRHQAENAGSSGTGVAIRPINECKLPCARFGERIRKHLGGSEAVRHGVALCPNLRGQLHFMRVTRQ